MSPPSSGKSWVMPGMPRARALGPLTGVIPGTQDCRNPLLLAHTASTQQSPGALLGQDSVHLGSGWEMVFENGDKDEASGIRGTEGTPECYD